jgi:ribonuclease D
MARRSGKEHRSHAGEGEARTQAEDRAAETSPAYFIRCRRSIGAPDGVPRSSGAGAVVELLKVLLKARAEDAGVDSKLIATMSDLEKIAADDEADTPALEGWRREAFGENALKVKRGELALVLDGARVRAVEVRRRPRS